MTFLYTLPVIYGYLHPVQYILNEVDFLVADLAERFPADAEIVSVVPPGILDPHQSHRNPIYKNSLWSYLVNLTVVDDVKGLCVKKCLNLCPIVQPHTDHKRLLAHPI